MSFPSTLARALFVVYGIAGCGRIGYDPTSAAPRDASGANRDPADARALDASAADGAFRDGSAPPSTLGCAPLPPPSTATTLVTPARASELSAIVATAPAGTTIVLTAGTYLLNRGDTLDRLVFAQPGVTLRSQNGDPASVILDAGFVTGIIADVQASEVTIAELTITRTRGVRTEGAIHVTPGAGGASRVGIYRVRIVDATAGIVIRGSPTPPHADNGTIACSEVTLTDAGRALVDCGSAVGITGTNARGWRVVRNGLTGMRCIGAPMRAIWFFERSRDTVIDSNVVLDSTIGIGLGLWDAPRPSVRTYADDPCATGAYIDHIGGTVCNNVVVGYPSTPTFDSGIALWSTCNAVASHNTVSELPGGTPQASSVEWRYAATRSLNVHNNLVISPMSARPGAVATELGNLVSSDPAVLFVGPTVGGYRLRPAPDNPALDAGDTTWPSPCTADIDGDLRSGLVDVGADELP